MVYSVSCTTRAPRGGEQNGHDYFFLSTDEFEKKIAAGEFLEYAKYNNHYYGTPRGFVEEQLAAGRDVLLDIEVQGAQQVAQCVRGGSVRLSRRAGDDFPDAAVIGIAGDAVAPSRDGQRRDDPQAAGAGASRR